MLTYKEITVAGMKHLLSSAITQEDKEHYTKQLQSAEALSESREPSTFAEAVQMCREEEAVHIPGFPWPFTSELSKTENCVAIAIHTEDPSRVLGACFGLLHDIHELIRKHSLDEEDRKKWRIVTLKLYKHSSSN
jgi:hypothetical protein